MELLSLGDWTMAGWLCHQRNHWQGWLRFTHHPTPVQLSLAGEKTPQPDFSKLFFEAYPFADCDALQLRELVRLSLQTTPKLDTVHIGSLGELSLTPNDSGNGSLLLVYETGEADVEIALPRVRFELDPEGVIEFLSRDE